MLDQIVTTEMCPAEMVVVQAAAKKLGVSCGQFLRTAAIQDSGLWIKIVARAGQPSERGENVTGIKHT